MKFSIGEHVQVNDGGVPWYGQVVAVLPPRHYRVRVGGTGGSTQMLRELEEDKLDPIITRRRVKPRKTRSVLKPVLDAHRLLLLGCPRHGLTCAETLVNYAALSGSGEDSRPFGTIFLEGFYFHAKHGLDEDCIKYSEDKKLIVSLRKICSSVIGLETEETTLSKKSLNEQEKFLSAQRCTVANARWSELIQRFASATLPNVVCCGTAHLVSVEESGKICTSLAQHLAPLGLRIVSMAVAWSESAMYNPEGSKSGALVAIPPIDEEEYDSE